MDILERCTCSICMELFADPSMLSCGHTFCQRCIEPLLRGQWTKKVMCPECRGESALPANGFPVNFCIRAMVNDIQASSGVRAVGSCGQCQKKVLLSELFFCFTCEGLSAETSRLCGFCIAKAHNGHYYKELELASEQDIGEALAKMATAHAVFIKSKNELIDTVGKIEGVVLQVEKSLDEGIASINMLVADISNGTTLTKDQLSKKVKEVEQCGQKGDVAAALTALREFRGNLLKTPAIQQASSGPLPGVATRSAVVDTQASAWRRRFNARNAVFPGAASTGARPTWHADIRSPWHEDIRSRWDSDDIRSRWLADLFDNSSSLC